jgi:hypothetical protein
LGRFYALKTEYQEYHGHGHANDDYRIGIVEAIKTDQEVFFLDTLMARTSEWEDQSASGLQPICDLFVKFIEQTYVDGFRRNTDWIL